MFHSKHAAILLAAGLLTVAAQCCVAKASDTQTRIAQTSTAPTSATYTIHFRLTRWKAQHIHDAQKAEERYKTLKSLGCEVKKYAHNGHIDVKYRQLKWTALSLKSQQESVQWQRWLRGMGFELRQVQ